MIAAIATLTLLGLAALGGGIEMIIWRHGNVYLPADRLDRIPMVDSYVLPGLILGVVFGVGSLVAAVGMLRTPRWRFLEPIERATGRHWSWAASATLGVAFLLWLTVELLLLGGPAGADTAAERDTAIATYAVFGTLALILVTVPHTRSVRRHLAVPGTTTHSYDGKGPDRS